jgi:hypothetical protein
MYMIQNIIKSMHTKFGQVVISIILGIGLASLFRRTCHDEDCYKFKSPKTSEVESTTYLHGGSCYKFKAETKNCESKKHATFA